jgi:hypothetical protein
MRSTPQRPAISTDRTTVGPYASSKLPFWLASIREH